MPRWLTWLRSLLRQPDPPTNVRIIWPDGVEQQLPALYIGDDDEGIHMFEAIYTHRHEFEHRRWVPFKVRMDCLPERTRLKVIGANPK